MEIAIHKYSHFNIMTAQLNPAKISNGGILLLYKKTNQDLLNTCLQLCKTVLKLGNGILDILVT